jgi:hypothetical protein
MPREIVHIDLSSKFPMEAGARFFSTLAYPDATHQRNQYSLQLCRWYVLRRVKDNPEFGRTPHFIIPAIFAVPEYDAVQILKRGNQKLHHNLTATYWIAMPHFRGIGLKPIQIDENGESVIPTVNNMSMLAMEELGWQGKGKSVPTLKSKIWAPSRPIVHAAAAFLLWRYYGKRLLPPEMLQIDSFFALACLENPSIIEAIIKKAEELRLMLPSIKQFHIKEKDTIQFLAEGTPLEFAEGYQQHQVDI